MLALYSSLKSICCINAFSISTEANELYSDIARRFGLRIEDLPEGTPIQNYDVVLYVYTVNDSKDAGIGHLLKAASDLNKTFIPVIIGGSFWSNLFDALRYKGPNLRTRFLKIHRSRDLFELYSSIASYLGVKLVGDPLGAMCNFTSDVDCQLLRGREIIAELRQGVITPVNLYYGKHHLIAQAKVDTKIKKKISLSVSFIDETFNLPIVLRKEIVFYSDVECFVYQNKRMVGNIAANRSVKLSLLEGKSKISFQIESSRLAKRFDHSLTWNGKDGEIHVSLKKRLFAKDGNYGITRSNYIAYHQLLMQKEALKRKMWSISPKEQKKVQIEIDNIDTKINKLKTSFEKKLIRILRNNFL